MMMKKMWEEELFWRENGNMDGHGNGWTWTLAVILLIFTCRFLTYRFRRCPRPCCPSTSSSSSVLPTTPTPALISLRTSGIISDLDLKHLIENLDDNCPDNKICENVIHKTCNSLSYKARCCKPKDGPLKYLSVATFEDCSVDMLLNFYMDNDYRMQWEKTVIHHQQLQLDHASATEIARTIKKFPFLTPREYVLAWRLWKGKDGSFYCFSKECDHPLVPKEKRYVRVAVVRSGWRIRKVPGRNACEIRMVHQEDAGLNVEMAKLAFAKGIWSYVCKMDDALRKYSNRKQQQLNSTASSRMSTQKVPPEFEVADDILSTVHSENSVVAANHHLGTCRPNMMKPIRMPSNNVVSHGLVLLGGAICLYRCHSSLGAKVAMAHLFSKLTKRGASKKEENLPRREYLNPR